MSAPALTENEILERVDEYTLYCFYLGFDPELGIKYSSPLRSDPSPSFGIFVPKKYPDRELMWKDLAKGWTGDIFELVKRLYPTVCRTKYEACQKICSDFGIGPFMDAGTKMIQNTIKPKSDVDIKITSRAFSDQDIAYWNKYNVSREILDRHHATSVKYFWMNKEQKVPFYPRTPGYAYRIWDRYQLYFPHNIKDFKFRSSYDERHLPGFLQLQYKHPLLIITKAKKDIMMFDSFGYEAVASRGENNPVPGEYLRHLEGKYDEIVMWRDNDGKTDDDRYPYRKLYVPIESGEKDPSDFCARYGPKETLLLIKQLTGYEPSI